MKVSRLVFLIILLIVPLTALAQEETDLSEEEIALLDRMIAGFEYRDEVSSYGFTETNEVALDLQLSNDNGTSGFNRSFTLERDGYVLRDPIGNIKEFFSINLSGVDAEDGEYEVTADATFIGETLYLETPDDLIVVDDPDNIPDEFADASLGGLFDDEQGLLQNRELFLAVLESATEEEAELDGEAMTLLTFQVAEDRVGDFVWEFFDTDRNAGNPTIIAMRDNGEGNAVIQAWLDSEDHLRRVELHWDIEAMNIDLGEISQFYAGNTLDSLTMSQSAIVELGQYEAEFEPIKAPGA